MPTARLTTQDDSNRLAENLNIFDPTIRDRDSFDRAYVQYLSGTDALTNKQLQEDTFNSLASRKGIRKERLFKKAGGKSLGRDRQQTARTIVKTRQEYIKQGAPNVDLEGFDTKRRVNRFNVLGQRGKQTVFAREVKVNNKFAKRKITVLRDQKGRFVRRRK